MDRLEHFIVLAQMSNITLPDEIRSEFTVNPDKGLQIGERVPRSNGKTKIQYTLTQIGEQHGRMQLDTAQNHSKTVYVVRWFTSVIPFIIDEFKD